MKADNLTNEILNISPNWFISQDEVEWEKIDDGIRRKVLSYDENLMMAVSEFKKGAIGIIHNHSHRQITFITRGIFEVQIENEKKILKEGDSFLVLPSLNHGVIALEESILVDVFAPYREDFLNK